MGYIAQKNLRGPSQHPYGPSLVVDHHFTRVILIGIIFFSPNSIVELVYSNYKQLRVIRLITSPQVVEPVWCTKIPPTHPSHTHRGWTKGHDPSYIPYSCLQNTNIAFRPTCHISMPKTSIQKKAATTSKNGIGSKFEHPDTFHICI